MFPDPEHQNRGRKNMIKVVILLKVIFITKLTVLQNLCLVIIYSQSIVNQDFPLELWWEVLLLRKHFVDSDFLSCVSGSFLCFVHRLDNQQI